MDFQRLQTVLAELRPEDKLTATITHWHESATKKQPGATPLAACSYATAILINGRVRYVMWGTGYAPEAIPPVVYGIETLLQVIPSGRRVEVHALAQLQEYLKLGGIGHYAMLNEGRTKSGNLLGIYPAIANIIQATPARWSLCPHKTMQEASGFAAAIAVARETARAAALKHKADHAPTSETYPKPIILQEFVDVFPG
jgi:hypothetical protein